MTNTINPSNFDPSRVDTWQFPAVTDTVASDTVEIQQHNYVDYLAADRESQAVEHGLPQTPIREGAATLNTVESVGQGETYVAPLDQPIERNVAEEVVTSANQVVNAAYDALPEAQQARLHQEHYRAANAQAGVYAPIVVTMRDRVLKQDDFELAA